MKRVSFSVAKALKEAGYKFTPAPSSFLTNETNSWYDEDDDELYTLPYVMEVFLWLWREKKIFIQVEKERCILSFLWGDSCTFRINSDPEEAIITAIEHLVTNNLIK